MKDDERRLLIQVLENEGRASWPRYIAEAMQMHPNRLRYLCEQKWVRKGFYEYGVVYDLGWIHDREAAQRYLDGGT